MARAIWAPVLTLCLLLAACTPPIALHPLPPRAAAEQLTRNVLTTGALSQATENVLNQADLAETWRTDPDAALARLHRLAVAAGADHGLLFALAEMSLQRAQGGADPAAAMAAVVYAYAFLFPADTAAAPAPFDPRLRLAADIYNLGLAQALATPGQPGVTPRGGRFALPFGTLTVDLDAQSLRWDGQTLTDFIAAEDYRISGLRNRYRTPGIGAPLAAGLRHDAPATGFQVAWDLKVPVTAVLTLDATPATLAGGDLHGRLRLYPTGQTRRIDIAGQSVPLETENSVAIAYTLSDPAIWESELKGFFNGEVTMHRASQLVAVEPYRPGRIPVVLIHGTASSGGRWADMLNDLLNDPAIRAHFQFWLFTYNTGNPIPVSAMQLRDTLTEALRRLDPHDTDPALHRIVLIGHSQGGLLAKMQVIDTGSRLFDAFSRRPLDSLHLSTETRDIIRRTMFLKPLPAIGRVIFIATPHRGSFLADRLIARWIGHLVSLPARITHLIGELVSSNADALTVDRDHLRGDSIAAMTPDSPLIGALSRIPVDPRVPAHSIIAVEGNGPPNEGDDGVVSYRSAHLNEAASELIIHSGHSVQGNPQTIAEVRRILLLHWRTACPDGCLPAVRTARTGAPRAPALAPAAARVGAQ